MATQTGQSQTQNAGLNSQSNRRATWEYHRNTTAPDPFNATAHRINDTTAPYWNVAPYYYNGTHYHLEGKIYPCVNFTNGSIGTNCSWIYGDLFLRGYYRPETPRCQPSLMQSYGFSGILIANSTRSMMCPGIEDSCCTHHDYFNAFRSWESSGIHSDLIARVNFLNNTYTEYLFALTSAYTMITNIGAKIPITNNCKVLANSIASFRVPDVASFLNGLVRQYFGYLSKNFEAFYCTMCNANNHPYFDLTRQRIIYSHKQCRDWTRNTLPFLLYFHLHITKINNLIIDFVSSCDATGHYTKVPINESLFKLRVPRRRAKQLLRCRNERDKLGWFRACLPVCRAISLTHIEPLLTPNFRKLTSIASYMNANIQIIQNQLFNQLNSAEVTQQKVNSARVLSAHPAHKKRRIARVGAGQAWIKRRLQQNSPAQKYNHLIIRTLNYENFERTAIPTALNARVDLDHLKPIFAADGLELEATRDSMAWNKPTYTADFNKWAENQPFGSDPHQFNLTMHRIWIAKGMNSERVLGAVACLLLWRLI